MQGKHINNISLYRNKNIDIKNTRIKVWIPEVYILTLYKSTIPKFITWIGSDTPTNIENYFHQNNPYNHLNYASEEVYLQEKNINKKKVILNSINHAYENIEEDELEILVEYFLPLIQTKKIKILNANTAKEIAVYQEIISYLNYVKKIEAIIMKGKSDKLGTAFRTSSLKKIVDTKISILQDRLDDPLIPITNQEEIDKLKYIIKMLKKSQEDNYKNLFEYINLGDFFTGLDIDMLELNETEKIAIQQAISFHNGKSNSITELIRSSMIYLNILFESPLNNANDYAESILNITYQFFYEEIQVINKEKNTLTFDKSHINKSYTLKSTSDKVPIFIYSNKKSPLEELIEIAFNSMAGLKNKLEPDNPTEEELSEYRIMKNILSVFKYELNFDRNDIRIFKYFFTLIEKGNFPLTHFVQ